MNANLVDNTNLERFLLKIGQQRIPQPVFAHVQAQLDKTADAQAFQLPSPGAAAAAAVKCPKNKAKDAPTYNPGMWNTPAVQPHNNCYNYANNQITNTFAQPGRAHAKQAQQMACPKVTTAAIADGLKTVPNFSHGLGPGKGWYVALVVWPNVDYHWYRQDNVGCWSHKPGQTAARNVDNGGQAIADPKTCNRGPYVDFCCYMVTRKGVVIK